MNQPRKFSENIKLIMKKQVEEAKAFENILREVQPLTSGIQSEAGLSSQLQQAHEYVLSYEDNMRSAWTKPNARSESSLNVNLTHNSVTNQLSSSICSTNLRDYNESLRPSEVHETYRKMADTAFYSNVPTIPTMLTNFTGEISSNLNNSCDIPTSESLTSSFTGKSSCTVNEAANIQQRYSDVLFINSPLSQPFNFQSDTFVSQNTKERPIYMTELDPFQMWDACCYFPDSTTNHPVMSISKPAVLESNSSSNTDQLIHEHIPVDLLPEF